MKKRFAITNWFDKFLCETKEKGLHWGNDIRHILTFTSAAEATEVLETADEFCSYEKDELTGRYLPKLLDDALHVEGFVEVNICELKFKKRYTRRWKSQK